MDDLGPEPLGGALLSSRLSEVAPLAGNGAYLELRETSADYVSSGVEGADDFGRSVLEVEELLERSYLLEQPSIAGMGLGAWDLAVRDPLAAMGKTQGRGSRMLRSGSLAGLLDDDDIEEEEEEADEGALARAADLLEAVQRLESARTGLPEEAPEALRQQVAALQNELRGRLLKERSLDRGLDSALDGLDLRDPETVQALRPAAKPVERALAATIVNPLAQRGPSSYAEVIDTVVAHDVVPVAQVADLRAQMQAEAEEIRAGKREKAAVERLRRLFAEEVALTGGAPASVVEGTVDSVELRREFADRETRTDRPDGGEIRPAAGLPEIPIWSGRGSSAKVVGYLRADEATQALGESGGFVKVPVPGRKRPGWVDAEHLDVRGQQPPEMVVSDRPKGQGPIPGLARLAMLTGQSVTAMSGQLEPGEKPEVARESRPERAVDDEPMGAPIVIDDIDVSGLDVPRGAEVANVVNAALALVPGLLDSAADPATLARLQGRTSQLGVSLAVSLNGADRSAHAANLARKIAGALLSGGAERIGTLHLDVVAHDPNEETRDALLAKLAAGDTEAIMDQLKFERRSLDGTMRSRLAQFFGDEFNDVMVFAGPMSGALARSLHAEALTHGKMVFFDPKHFRPDTAQGQALLAHELTHTRQEDDRDVRRKEAQALATEAAFLSWLQPGGANVAENVLDPTAPYAARAADNAIGMRAEKGRSTGGGGGGTKAEEGPREETAKFEEQVKQVLEFVSDKIRTDLEFERDRIGSRRGTFEGPF